jgi:hypothetical protein
LARTYENKIIRLSRKRIRICGITKSCRPKNINRSLLSTWCTHQIHECHFAKLPAPFCLFSSMEKPNRRYPDLMTMSKTLTDEALNTTPPSVHPFTAPEAGCTKNCESRFNDTTKTSVSTIAILHFSWKLFSLCCAEEDGRTLGPCQ